MKFSLPYFKKAWLRWLAVGLGSLLCVIVLLNVALAWYYNSRTYANTRIGTLRLDSLTISDAGWTDNQHLLPDKIWFIVGSNEKGYATADLGIALDIPKLTQQVRTQRSWLPIYNLLWPPSLTLPLTIDHTKLETTLQSLQRDTAKPATNAKIVLKDGNFMVEPAKDGQQIDIDLAKQQVLKVVPQRQSVILLTTSSVKPTTTSDTLQADLQSLQTKSQVAITLAYDTKRYQLTSQQIAGWYIPGELMPTLDDTAMASSLKQIAKDNFGISMGNLNQVIAASRSALSNNKASTITVTAILAQRNYRYCVAVRGVEATELPALESKLAATLNDARGWGIGGKINFVKATTGCNLVVWLSAASQMTSFSSACDAIWSCTVSPNVIINMDRWQNATDSWNANGGTLEDYRVMAINHEVGHWLGFGHVSCGGAGQLAPIMQQQSVNLQGCLFNAWPLPSEQTALRNRLGV